MPWTKEKSLQLIKDVGLIPIVRTASSDDAVHATEAIIASGVGIVEITMTVPHALNVMEHIVNRFEEQLLVGAGTILDAKSCVAAISAGAQFIVTPSFCPRVVEVAVQECKPCFPGALTPTEIVAAWRSGADLVKVFPCGTFDGPQYIKALKGPLPHIGLIPTGGVNVTNAKKFIQAGAAAIAVGGELVDSNALRMRKLEVITENARQLLAAVQSARAQVDQC